MLKIKVDGDRFVCSTKGGLAETTEEFLVLLREVRRTAQQMGLCSDLCYCPTPEEERKRRPASVRS